MGNMFVCLKQLFTKEEAFNKPGGICSKFTRVQCFTKFCQMIYGNLIYPNNLG